MSFSLVQLARAGLSSDRIDGLIARRDLLIVRPGVYTSPATPDSSGRRMWAAVLWSGGVLSHESAAAAWQIALPVATTVIHLTVADRRYRKPVTGIRLHRVPLGTCSNWGALPITTRDRTVVDLLRTWRYASARDLLDRALQRGWLDEAALRDSIKLGYGRTGNGQLRRLIDDLVQGAHAESERRLHRLLRSAAVTGWRPQLPIGGAHADVGFAEQRLILEVEGRRHHGQDSDAFESDRIRHNAFTAAGWRVLRITWLELTSHPDRVLAQIMQLLAA